MRARAVHDAIAAFDRTVPDGRERLRDRVPEPSWQIITRTKPLGWIAVEHDRHIPTAIVDLLGPAEAHNFFRSLLVQQLDSNLLRATLAATLRLFGMSPASLARSVPVGWDVVYRDVCRIRHRQEGAASAVLTLERIVPEVLEAPAYLASFRGFFAGFLDICHVEGSAELTHRTGSSTAEISLEWGPALHPGSDVPMP